MMTKHSYIRTISLDSIVDIDEEGNEITLGDTIADTDPDGNIRIIPLDSIVAADERGEWITLGDVIAGGNFRSPLAA